MILFYDKTHVDNHGSLACSPVIMWPTFFNQKCRNMVKFTRVLGYVPNMSLGKSKSDSQKSKDKVQAEHDCLRPVVNQVKEIYENGGIKTKVMGRHVNVVIWIHIITGDTSGHNDLCGHMNASSTKLPVRTCRCTSDILHDPEAICNFSLSKK